MACMKLDIVDKHKLLIPVVSIVALNGVSAEDDQGGSFTGLNMFINQNGTVQFGARAANLKITNYGNHGLSYFSIRDMFLRQGTVLCLP